MTREINFKAWDKNEKTMLIGAGHNEPLSCDTLNALQYPDEKVYMQYTGLKDKNGTDIYEGDIVNISGSNENIIYPNIKRPVKYSSGCYYVDSLKLDTLLVNIKHLCKVIGNIYQNPELLK